MCVYLSIKFQVSNIIVMDFRQGEWVIFPPSPPQNEPLEKPTQITVNGGHQKIPKDSHKYVRKKSKNKQTNKQKNSFQ